MAFDFTEGDTGIVLRVTCQEPGATSPLNLTGYTALLRWQAQGVTVERNMTIPSPATGIVEYEFLADEIEAPHMELEVVLVDGDGKERTSLSSLKRSVRQHL